MNRVGTDLSGRGYQIRLGQSPFASNSQASSPDEIPGSPSRSANKMQDEEHPILSWIEESSTGKDNAQPRGIETTPLLSHNVLNAINDGRTHIDSTKFGASFFPQYGLLGLREASYKGTTEFTESRNVGNVVYANINAPWSTFICGSQGAGKSHTLSCLLESSLQQQTEIGNLPNPLSGIIFHYDKFTGSTSHQVCEAAYLSSCGIPVRVLVSPSNRFAMKAIYKNLPGLEGSNLEVIPLYLTERQLNISNMIKLMNVDQSSESTPLYLDVVFRILREMAEMSQGRPGVNYVEFIRRLSAEEFTPAQKKFLNFRLQLLQSLMLPRKSPSDSDVIEPDLWGFPPGTLTIVDLSDPFVSSNDACALFNICLSLFLERRSQGSCVVALDEAHKFLTESKDASDFTDALTSVIAQQRHLAARVIIATQEPTLSPRLLDLCNVTIVHQFLSPAWFSILQSHLAGAGLTDNNRMQIFETILKLEPGQALMFSPKAVLDIGLPQSENVDAKVGLIELGSTFIRIKIRKRITVDGGKSILASDQMGAGLLSALKSNQAFEEHGDDTRKDDTRKDGNLPLRPKQRQPSSSATSSSAERSQSLPLRTRSKEARPPPKDVTESQKVYKKVSENNEKDELHLEAELEACERRIKQLNAEVQKLPGKKRARTLRRGLRSDDEQNRQELERITGSKRQRKEVSQLISAEQNKINHLRWEISQIQDKRAQHGQANDRADTSGQSIVSRQTPVTL